MLTVKKPHRQIKNIRGVELGNTVRLQAHFPSPYPCKMLDQDLLMCEGCLGFFRTRDERIRHWRDHCTGNSPPGEEIYKGEEIRLYEVDGYLQQLYCERLLLLSKLFLEEKRVSDMYTSQTTQVSSFFFYILVKKSGELIGYFSVMKPWVQDQYVTAAPKTILSCILVLPHEQRRGYGKFMIDVAYEMAKREGRRGTAERPLSVAGRHSFYSYWTGRVLKALQQEGEEALKERFTMGELSEKTDVIEEDLLECLKDLGVLRHWGSNNLILLTHSAATDIMKRTAGKSPGFPFNKQFLTWNPLLKRSPARFASSTACSTANVSYAASEHDALLAGDPLTLQI
jgi:GNAT superfamily N-acetyltransferase